MVILIATEDTSTLDGLERFLARHTQHQILAANSLEAVEDVGTEAEAMDVLLCARHFSTTDGQAVQEAMQSKFPCLYAGYFTDIDFDPSLQLGLHDRCFGPSSSHYEVLNWIHELEKLPPPVAPQTQPITLPDTLLNHTIGDYKILAKRSTFERSESYQALQISMHRLVVLERLKAEFQHDLNAKRNFRALVRSQANVAHPSIATVFEAQETEAGEIFYTREFVKGKSLPELAAAKVKLPQRDVLALLRAAGEAMVFYANREIPHYRLRPQHLFQGDDGLPRLANLATIPADARTDSVEDFINLAKAVEAISNLRSGQEAELATILKQMRGQAEPALQTWPKLVLATTNALQRLAEISAAQPPKLGHMTGRLRRPKRKKWPFIIGGGACALAAVSALLYPGSTPEARKLEEFIHISAGPGWFGTTSVPIKEFWISKYEVTIAQYAEFLAANPALNPSLDHADQPKGKTSHKPLNWDDYFPAAQTGGTFKGHKITLNCPVLWADWWDAYAYAKWRGQRLPNEQEWEHAARGPTGYAYPWGNEPAISKANTGDDLSATPAGGGQTDGFRWWCDVDAKPEDISPGGVRGMGGNVAEWTTSWSQHPDFPDQQSPVYRGGSFSQPSAPVADQRWAAKTLDLAQPFIGFRTVSDHSTAP
jgi:hypothetical protein